MKKPVLLSTILLFLIFNASSHAVTLLEYRLREIRDEYRHNSHEGTKKIEILWDEFPDVDDRLRIFLDLNHYYQKHSLDKLLINQGKWLLKKNIQSEKSRIWIITPIAETLAKQNDFNGAVTYYDKAFAIGCRIFGKNPRVLSREDFIKNGTEAVSLWGETAINASLVYARAGKFNDAYTVLNSAKAVIPDGAIKSGFKDIDYERTKIQILGLVQGKSKNALQALKLLNEGKPFFTIEPETIQTPEEKLCLMEKEYKLLSDLYLNTLIINPPCDLLTYKRIIANGRGTVYVLRRLLELFKNDDFCDDFEKKITDKLKESNMPHINLLFAEYYFNKKNYKEAAFYYEKVIKQGKNQIYRWPKYYPDLDSNGNYQSPHRPYLWVTCYERAKEQLKK
ncbi:MAG: tetratricopeptide repeat protein [bacterium]